MTDRMSFSQTDWDKKVATFAKDFYLASLNAHLPNRPKAATAWTLIKLGLTFEGECNEAGRTVPPILQKYSKQLQEAYSAVRPCLGHGWAIDDPERLAVINRLLSGDEKERGLPLVLKTAWDNRENFSERFFGTDITPYIEVSTEEKRAADHIESGGLCGKCKSETGCNPTVKEVQDIDPKSMDNPQFPDDDTDPPEGPEQSGNAVSPKKPKPPSSPSASAGWGR